MFEDNLTKTFQHIFNSYFSHYQHVRKPINKHYTKYIRRKEWPKSMSAGAKTKINKHTHKTRPPQVINENSYYFYCGVKTLRFSSVRLK